ncbi:MAG TPA: phage Gp37/Gp68 family protein [Dehalococcoidales bacterium]|nr:phage Gp37/Gp68 family protein [Dehalococcoidales bacterium]
MALNSSIEWTGATWNPVTGCTKISPGCLHCYAERMALRLQAMGQANYINGFKVATHPRMLELPLHWKKPQFVFVNSMGDLFHEDVPVQFVLEVFEVMRRASQHTFQLLTKRTARLADLNSHIDWPSNVWMGVTVENGDYKYRVDDLRSTAARVKFLSLEPLIGPIYSLNLSNIDWAIVGGESGPGARPIEKSWVNDLREQCQKARVPFFFKQWGGPNRRKTGRLLDGRTWDEIPRNAIASP